MNPLTFLGLDKTNQWRVSKEISYADTTQTPSGLYISMFVNISDLKHLEKLVEVGNYKEKEKCI